MGFWSRLFGRGKEEKTSRTFAAGSITSGYYGADWSDYQNYTTQAKDSYLKNLIAFACIDRISRAVSSVPWLLYRKKLDGTLEEVLAHPFLSVLERANPWESFSFFQLKRTAYLVMCGNSFVERAGPEFGPNKGIPRELYSLRPDRFDIVLFDSGPLKGTPKQYEYRADGGSPVIFEIDPITGKSDILQLKTFHPLNDWWGSAITQSAGREIDTSNEATESNKKLLENDGRPGLIITLPSMLGDTVFDRLDKQLKARHMGSKNAGKHLILDGGADAKPYAWSPKEIDFIETHRELARRISLGYGVPSMLLGIPGDNTYSNYQEARLAFWEETITFYLNYLVKEDNYWLFPDGDLILSYSLDDAPALAIKREKKWKQLQETDFLTINEKREAVGYDVIDGGDILLVPATMIPIDQVGIEVEEGEEETEETGKAIQKLIDGGMSEEEARELLSLPPKEEAQTVQTDHDGGNGKGCIE